MDINGAVADKVAEVLSMLDLPWPGGDPAALRRFAGEWRAMAGELATTADGLDREVHAVVGSSWRGSAADAFAAHWQQQHRTMQQSVQNFEAVAKELDHYADEAEQIIEAIVEIALEIAEFELAGAFLTIVTAGVSDAVAAAAAGERALKIAQLIDKFTTMAKRAERIVTELIEKIRELGMIPRIMVDALKNSAMNLSGTQLTNLVSGKGPVGGSDLETAALAGIGAAGLSGGAARLGDKLFTSSGAHAAPSKINAFLQGDGTGNALAMGGLAGAGGSAFADMAQGKDGRTTIADTLTGGVTGGIGAGRAEPLRVDPLGAPGVTPSHPTWTPTFRSARRSAPTVRCTAKAGRWRTR
ncbi:WXG100 family type VII secretion target [Streptacidiphilus melanogenes]|uniref:WXG100 family type VII secretion target n=1 Tax=Streptacidiphilus melanogenes TaxID=411235 RepID=UPI0005A99A36|nr:WXG100 family type VII secretion target [Streptacidiphilus melanogenes]